MLSKTGVALKELVKSVFPLDLSSFKAVIECYQEIPCNPCEFYCPFDAIEIGQNINNLPLLIESKCVGCGICVGVCPGLAIMLVKEENESLLFTIPYELALPDNDVCKIVNRTGEVIGDGVITKVVKTELRTLVTVQCDKQYLYDFGGILYE
jgi:Fe-S-cluster-containing hydrogenase component 2